MKNMLAKILIFSLFSFSTYTHAFVFVAHNFNTNAQQIIDEEVSVKDFTESKFKPINVSIYLPKERRASLPAVIFLSGCDGKHWSIHEQLAKKLIDKGVVIAEVQSIETFGNQCMKATLKGRDRAVHAFAAKELLVKKGLASPTNIGLVGLSHGAWTTVEALLESISFDIIIESTMEFQHRENFAAGVALYPYCTMQLSNRKPRSPLLILGGTQDTWTLFNDCKMYIDKDPLVQFIEYENATHGWDVPLPTRTRATSFGQTTMSYDSAATEDAIKKSFDFLMDSLKFE